MSLDCIHCEKSIAVYCGKCADVRAQEFQTGLVAQALAGKVARTDAVNRLLSANGCDCECDHAVEEDHEEDCERCLACRIDAALNGKDEP